MKKIIAITSILLSSLMLSSLVTAGDSCCWKEDENGQKIYVCWGCTGGIKFNNGLSQSTKTSVCGLEEQGLSIQN